MTIDPVASRYAQALFEAAKGERATEPGHPRRFASSREMRSISGTEPRKSLRDFSGQSEASGVGDGSPDGAAGGAADQTLEQLLAIGTLLRDHPDLRQFLWNPDVEPEDKLRVLGRLLAGGWSPLLQAFVRMTIAMGRVEHLPAIVEAFQALADEAAGRMHAVVRTARPLPEAALKRLHAVLERREGKRVELRAELAPELLGGLQVQLDHRVIDGSVRRQLAELGERLAAVRVH